MTADGVTLQANVSFHLQITHFLQNLCSLCSTKNYGSFKQNQHQRLEILPHILCFLNLFLHGVALSNRVPACSSQTQIRRLTDTYLKLCSAVVMALILGSSVKRALVWDISNSHSQFSESRWLSLIFNYLRVCQIHGYATHTLTTRDILLLLNNYSLKIMVETNIAGTCIVARAEMSQFFPLVKVQPSGEVVCEKQHGFTFVTWLLY